MVCEQPGESLGKTDGLKRSVVLEGSKGKSSGWFEVLWLKVQFFFFVAFRACRFGKETTSNIPKRCGTLMLCNSSWSSKTRGPLVQLGRMQCMIR